MSEKDKKTTFKRKFISLEVKIQILDRLLKGEKASHIGKSLNLNEATVRTIKKNEKEIRSAVAAGSLTSAKHAARPRAPIIEKMEKALSIWIDDCCQKRIPLDGNIIKQKALKIYKHLKEQGESSVNPDFVASKGWFEKFRKRFAIHSIRIQGESHETVRTYPEKIQNIIEEQGYTADQVFNADETGLWWKKMPTRTFISKKEKTAPGFKVSKDRLTLLLCSNASGDFMTKPLLVYRSLNPRALKGVNKNTLPVYWKANPRAWVTGNLFKDWFLNCFVPDVERYLRQKNLSLKVLLLLDNAPCHPQDLNHPNVKILFLPPNTTSLLQPLDQGIIYTFKTYYIRRALEWILDVTDSKSINVMEAWKKFSIKHCIDIISLSLKELKTSTLNACWKKIWRSSVEIENVPESSENEIGGILELAKSIGGEGFVDMTIEDVQDLLVEGEVDEADLMEMASEAVNQIDSEDTSTDEDCAVNNLTLKKLKEGLSLAENLESFFLNADPSTERSRKFKMELRNCLAPYREIYNDLVRTSNQSTITNFFKREEDARTLNEEKSSESESDIIPPKKRSRLIIHTEQ
ncbi:tigger transposable element-derived protein 1-like [Ceratina calcarata]|uniref:Tigger transposable element-derived protein 1-like n=1 Tax=Ceratina calcarata TaxID=156304 RepID=A0AAJ7JFI0_9HYME|nr:tigger transposable element-derived protein 1-like [Ceratina calcarata]